MTIKQLKVPLFLLDSTDLYKSVQTKPSRKIISNPKKSLSLSVAFTLCNRLHDFVNPIKQMNLIKFNSTGGEIKGRTKEERKEMLEMK